MNQIILVGRIAKDIEIIENDDKKQYIVTLAVQRTYKNVDGIYETDFIPCVLWNIVGERTLEYCKKGDVVGIKGRIQCELTSDDSNFVNGKTLQIIAEKVTFLSAKKES